MKGKLRGKLAAVVNKRIWQGVGIDLRKIEGLGN
jgi:hypothetical protein